MKITKVLYTSKTLANGEHPIMIRIAHKGKNKYVTTSTSCKASHWSKTLELIGAKDSKREEKNKIITSLYLLLQNRLADMEEKGIEPTYELLLSTEPIKDEDKERINLIHLYGLKAEASKAPRTKGEYRTMQRVMQHIYGDFININDISQVWANELREKIDRYYGEKNAQKNHFIKCFQGTYSYAEEIGVIPFRKAIRIKNFKHEKEDKYLSTEEVSVILSAYKKDIVARARALEPQQELALSVFILMMAFQGIANIDLAGVRVKDIEIKTIKKISVDWEQYYNSEEYKQKIDHEQEERNVVVMTFYRRKTEARVEVCADYLSISPILQNLMREKSGDDYLIPCFSDKTIGNKKKEIERSGRFYHKLKVILNGYLKEFCEIWNLKEIENLTYYQARSAFVNQVADMDIPHNLIQKMLGQKQSVLEKHYLKPATQWEQSEVSYRIFNKTITIADLLSQRPQ